MHIEKPVLKAILVTFIIAAIVFGSLGYYVGKSSVPVATPTPTATVSATPTPVAKVSATPTATSSPTEDVEFSIYGQIHWGADLFFNDKDFLLVDVKFVNQSGAQAYIDVNDFRLKDTNNVSHPLYFNSEVSTQPRFQDGVENLPDGRVELRSQNIEAAETLNGAIIFYVPKAAKTFDLIYKSKTYRLTIK